MSNYGMLSGSEICFQLPTSPKLTEATYLSSSSSFSSLRFQFNPNPIPSTRIRTRFLSLKAKAATINGDLATEEVTNKSFSFYDLLGISESGSLPEIKQAYKQLARKYHPDVCPPGRVEEYTKRFIQVQEAYETLSDPRLRAMYDRDLAKGLQLAFSARKRSYGEGIDDIAEWKIRWQSQLSELKRRSAYKDAKEDMSWAARMRRQRSEAAVQS